MEESVWTEVMHPRARTGRFRKKSAVALATQERAGATHSEGLSRLMAAGMTGKPISKALRARHSGFVDAETGQHHPKSAAWKFEAGHPVIPTITIDQVHPMRWYVEPHGPTAGKPMQLRRPPNDTTPATHRTFVILGMRGKKAMQQRPKVGHVIELNEHPGVKFKKAKGLWFSEAEIEELREAGLYEEDEMNDALLERYDYFAEQTMRLELRGRSQRDARRIVLEAGRSRFGPTFDGDVAAGRELFEALEADAAIELLEAKDSLIKASTPEPFSHSKTSNWVARGGGLPPYIQHIAHDLHEKRGMPVSRAIQMAIGIVKRWARGGGNVDANTRAAAAKAVAQWEALKAKAHAKPG